MTGDEPSSATLAALVGGYLSLSAWMFAQERAMRAGDGTGIVGLELAGSPRRVEEILAAWGAEGRVAARRSLLIDYGVLVCYGPLMSALCKASARRLERKGRVRLAGLGRPLAAGQLVAASADAVENTALLAVIEGRRGRMPTVATASAITKFSLLAAGAAYAAIALVSPSTEQPEQALAKAG